MAIDKASTCELICRWLKDKKFRKLAVGVAQANFVFLCTLVIENTDHVEEGQGKSC